MEILIGTNGCKLKLGKGIWCRWPGSEYSILEDIDMIREGVG
jgi:hypothetical protein